MLIAALAVLVGATVQSATGFGLALISGPVLFAVLPPAGAVSALLVLATVTTALVFVRRGTPSAVLWRDLRLVLAAAVPGLVAGVVILTVAPKAALQLAVGVGVLVAVALQVRGTSPPPEDERSSAGTSVAVGLTAGVLTTTTNTNGPPLVLWLAHRRATPGQTRDTLAAAFFTLNVVGGATLVLLGRSGADVRWSWIGVLLAVAVAGHLAGRVVFARLHPRWFRTAGIVLSALSGMASIVAAVA